MNHGRTPRVTFVLATLLPEPTVNYTIDWIGVKKAEGRPLSRIDDSVIL